MNKVFPIFAALSGLFFLGGCVINVKEKSKEIVLEASSAGIKKVSVGENLVEESGIRIRSLDSMFVILKTVARVLSPEGEEPDFERIQMSISSGGVIRMTHSGEDWAAFSFDRVELSIFKKTGIVVSTASGDIDVDGIQGDADFETSGGDISASLGYDSLQDSTTFNAKTAGGDCTVELPAYPSGLSAKRLLMTLESTSGDITIRVRKGFTAHLVFKTKSGKKNISSDFIESSISRTTINCTTKSGNLKIQLL